MTHGEIWLINFGDPVGSLPTKIRPAVVMQMTFWELKPCLVLNTADGVSRRVQIVNSIASTGFGYPHQ